MEFKGTPAPWFKDVRTNKKGSTRIVVIIPKKYGDRIIETELLVGHICDDDCGVETCCRVEEHSNARLIAAAPKLLNALQLLVDNYYNDDPIGIRRKAVNTAQAAINEALNQEA